MSYILEALKKSQQQRELGQVPRLEENWLEELPDAARPHPWVLGSLVLAAIALTAAIYAIVRSAGLTPNAVPVAEVAAQPAVLQPVPQPNPQPQTASAVPDSVSAPVRVAEPMPPPEDFVNLSAEPHLLVVPAPDPDGRPLPRGAEEIRRAVLGEPLSYSVDADADADGGPLPPPDGIDEEPEVPDSLKAEIEAFKREVSGKEPAASPSAPQAPAKRTAVAKPDEEPLPFSLEDKSPAPPSEIVLPQGPSSALRARIPPYSLSVHVYNADPLKRFVYINGAKFTEGERTREGLRVDEITAAGAILSFEGERFFQRP